MSSYGSVPINIPFYGGDEDLENSPAVNREQALSKIRPTAQAPSYLVPVSSSSLFNGHSSGSPFMSPKNQSLTSERDYMMKSHTKNVKSNEKHHSSEDGLSLLHYIVYAAINVIISVPGLYGYASVIFNHPVFAPHMNSLAKLVIFSSSIHQLGMSLFSGLPFAIATVQDAGLIFLSTMSNIIADAILNDSENPGTVEQVVSTTCVLLSLGTAMLGLILIFLGKYKLADAVSYLPMPVVGGYLAFIGYFCIEAGVGLCISKPMVQFKDWSNLLEENLFFLGLSGMVTGLVLTLISRNAKSNAALPVAMVMIVALFYFIIFGTGIGMYGAREKGWIGEVSPPVPIQDLFALIDVSLVRWDLIQQCMPTWAGMVFVVAFASCLDVAAISMDMGEALDSNQELKTVGIANVMSGLTFGFTGSYIFSQTIFTFRAGVRSRLVGILVNIVYWVICLSTVNLLEISPLFFLGSTLIFIGYDLLYEWVIEVRHKLLLSEYIVLLITFVSIHIIGINGGIIIGMFVATLDYVLTTATVSSLTRVNKRSRTVWKPDDRKLLQHHGYHAQHPKIVTFEVKGSVFFGSSLQLLSSILDEVCLNISEKDVMDISLLSPHTSGYRLSNRIDGTTMSPRIDKRRFHRNRSRPDYIVLDLSQTSNLDASAARGCFLQLAKMCSKHGMIVCASGAHPRIDWMLRSHEVAYGLQEEDEVKKQLHILGNDSNPVEKLLLFLTLYEALEFCEELLIKKLHPTDSINKAPSFIRLENLAHDKLESPSTSKQSLSRIFSHVLGLNEQDTKFLDSLKNTDAAPFHEEIHLKKGDFIFRRDEHPDSFFVVLNGAVAVIRDDAVKKPAAFFSGAGRVKLKHSGSYTALADLDKTGSIGEIKAFLNVGGIFGFVDFILDRSRSFSTVSVEDNTVVAKISRNCITDAKHENPELSRIVQSVILHASVQELANCTCSE